jgi:integrase
MLNAGGGTKRHVAKLGAADDKGDADAEGSTYLSFSQAQDAARKLFERAKRKAKGLPDIAAGPYTVEQAMTDYLKWLEGEGRSKANIDDARRKSEGHIIPKLGEVRLDRLARHQIEGWRNALAKAPPRVRVKAGAKQRHRHVDMSDHEIQRQRQSTANRVFGILKAALNLAWRNHKVADDKPWRSVRPFKGATASRARYLLAAECQRLVNASDSDFRALVLAGLHTGARYSELARLSPKDFNPDAATLAVRKSKSGKPRHIVLTEEGETFFAEAVAKAHNREFLFVRADGEPWKTSWQIRPMKAACEAAHIKPGAGFHVLRHTWASHAVMNGVPLLLVARNLGHRDTRMTELHYGHLAPSFEADMIRRGGFRLGAVPAGVVTPLGRRRRQ